MSELVRIPLIIDHDIGTNPDDFFALDFVFASQRAEVLMLISGNGEPESRARYARKILDLYGYSSVPSFVGEPQGCADFYCRDAISGTEEIKVNYLDAVIQALAKFEKVYYLAIQGLSNLARIFKEIPQSHDRIEVVHMGLSTLGFDDYIEGGTNMRADPAAAQFVYERAKNLRIVGLQTTLKDELRMAPNSKVSELLRDSRCLLAADLRAHLKEFIERRKVFPAMHDPLTASVILGFDFVEFEKTTIEFNERGLYRKGGPIGIEVSKIECRVKEFMALQAQYFAKNFSK